MRKIRAALIRASSKINRHYLVLILILILAAFFRFNGLASREIWYDEALTIIQSEKSIFQISHDVPTPVHYYFVHLFLLFGKSTFTLGLPSVIFGLLSVWLVYLIGKKIGGKNVGLFSAFLLAISPMHIEFSQQILHYSYFVFFTLASLFFYIKFIFSFRDGAVKYKDISWLILANVLNALTHVSALLVIAIEVLFFVLFFITFQIKHRTYLNFFKKKTLFFIGVGTVLILGILAFGNGYYVGLFKNLVNYGPHKSIELGYSLSKQLGSPILVFNKAFFAAMFSWFGLGKGIRLYALLILFFLGAGSMIKKRMFVSLFFLLFWIAYPFIQLYFVRPVHWFEEKYFIFMIPAYIIVISSGIIGASEIILLTARKIKKINRTGMLYFFQISIAVIILLMALTPIESRMTYGFPVEKKPSIYSWKKVYNYLKANIKENDRIFVRSGEGAFFDFYFPKEARNRIWFEENYLYKLNSDEFKAFINNEGDNYFVTIPNIDSLFLSNSLEKQDVKKIGGFNAYRVSWKRNDLIELKNDSNGRLQYYDDFSSSKLFSDAYYWNNFVISYLGNFNLPLTYGYNNLVPIDSDDCDIVYHFTLPKTSNNNLFLKPLFSLDNNANFDVYFGYDQTDMAKIYEKESDTFSYFNPVIKLNLDKNKKDFFIKLHYTLDSDDGNILGKNKIKSILLYDNINFSIEKYNVSVVGDGNNLVEYDYNAGLETGRNNKWIYDTSQNYGWIQANDGILFMSDDFAGHSPLVYNFDFEKTVGDIDLEVKNYTLDNRMSIYSSTDRGNSWTLLKEYYNDSTNISSILIKNDMTKNLQLKFDCAKKGPTCQLRNLSFKAIEAKPQVIK